MISSFGRAPLLNRTNSGDDTLSTLARFAQSDKVELNQFPKASRRGFTPSSINKKHQQLLQHFVPMNSQAEKPKGRKSLSTPKNESRNSSVKSTRISGVYSQTGLQSPGRRGLTPSTGSSRALITPKSVSRKNIFNNNNILPEPPLCSPRSVTDVVRMEDMSVSAEWMNDGSLYSTPVFQKRLSRPAIMIQSHARRMLASKAYQAQRRNKAAIQIQRIARGISTFKSWLDLYPRFKAAQLIQKVARGGLVRYSLRAKFATINIQRVARGFVDRLKVKVLRLENLLAKVQSEHAKELKMIEKNKKRRLRKSIPSTVTKIRQKMQKQKDKKERLATDAITELRKSNRHIREQNSQLEVQCEELVKRNERGIAATTKCFQHVEDLKATVKKLEADQNKLLALNCHFEKKVNEMTDMIREYDEMIEFERKVSSIYVNTIKDQIQQINSVCIDKDLASNIYEETVSRIEKAQTLVKACA